MVAVENQRHHPNPEQEGSANAQQGDPVPRARAHPTLSSSARRDTLDQSIVIAPRAANSQPVRGELAIHLVDVNVQILGPALRMVRPDYIAQLPSADAGPHTHLLEDALLDR